MMTIFARRLLRRPPPPTSAARRGFTLIEILIVLLILAITSLIAVAAIGRVESAQRADRAARELVAAVRCARTLAMTTGKTCGVAVDTVNQNFSVYRKDPSGGSFVYTTVSEPLTGSGLYQVNLRTQRELAGTGVSASLAGTGGVVRFDFGPLGSNATPGTVTFNYASAIKRVTIPAVGEPIVN